MRVNLLSCFSSLFIRYYLSWFPDDVEDLFVNCKSFIRFPLVLAMGWFPSWWIMFWFDPGCGNSILLNFCFYFILSFKCFTGLYNWKVDCSFDKKKKKDCSWPRERTVLGPLYSQFRSDLSSWEFDQTGYWSNLDCGQVYFASRTVLTYRCSIYFLIYCPRDFDLCIAPLEFES